MKSYVEEYMQTIYQDRFTIVTGQARIGKKVIRYAGAACLNEEDKCNKDIGKNLAMSRAMENLSDQLGFIARKMKSKAYKQIRNNAVKQSRSNTLIPVDEFPDENEYFDEIEKNSDKLYASKATIDASVDENDIVMFLEKPSFSAVGRNLGVSANTIKNWRYIILTKGFESLTTFAKLKILSAITDGMIDSESPVNHDINNIDMNALKFLNSDTYSGVGRVVGVSGDTIKAWINRITNDGFFALTPFAQNKLQKYIVNYDSLQNHLAE